MIDALVIGGGFSGALTALHLAQGGIATLVVEPGELGRGIAYASELPGEQVPLGCAAEPVGLLLNTPSAAMSALPDRPDDFVAWLATRGLRYTFAPRALYGTYLRDKLAGVAQVRARAVDVVAVEDGFRVACDDGIQRTARHVVLALGNAPPRTPEVLRGLAGYHADPYRPVAVPRDRPVALLGAGLTALDVVATLRARGHTGRLLAISRRGRVPQLHPGVAVPAIAPPRATTLAGLLAWWRTAGDATAKLAALRPLTPALWRGLSPGERAGFVRHVRPLWETVRHRAPPEVHAHLASIELVRGHVTGAAQLADGVRLAVGAQTLDVAAVVNCTGPERDLARIDDPLIASLLMRRLVERDPLGLGAAWLAPGLHAVGPWRVGTEWESTAVAELRVQAVEVAREIRTSLRAGPRRA